MLQPRNIPNGINKSTGGGGDISNRHINIRTTTRWKNGWIRQVAIFACFAIILCADFTAAQLSGKVYFLQISFLLKTLYGTNFNEKENIHSKKLNAISSSQQ